MHSMSSSKKECNIVEMQKTYDRACISKDWLHISGGIHSLGAKYPVWFFSFVGCWYKTPWVPWSRRFEENLRWKFSWMDIFPCLWTGWFLLYFFMFVIIWLSDMVLIFFSNLLSRTCLCFVNYESSPLLCHGFDLPPPPLPILFFMMNRKETIPNLICF